MGSNLCIHKVKYAVQYAIFYDECNSRVPLPIRYCSSLILKSSRELPGVDVLGAGLLASFGLCMDLGSVQCILYHPFQMQMCPLKLSPVICFGPNRILLDTCP